MTGPQPDSAGGDDGPVQAALRAAVRPLARLAVARAVGLGALQTILKGELVRAARRMETPAPSQSRISLMTGVHRKDVRDLLAGGPPGGAPPRASVAETVAARWLADPRRRGADGPRVLTREGAAGFDALVASVSKDVRPRSVLDEMIRLGLAAEAAGDEASAGGDAAGRGPAGGDAAGGGPPGAVRLLTAAATPRDGARALALFAENLADHAATGVDNLLAAPDDPRSLERAVFYDHLSPASIEALEAASRQEAQASLERLNSLAAQLQARDVAEGIGSRRFRFGVYFHAAPQPGAPDHDRDEEGGTP